MTSYQEKSVQYPTHDYTLNDLVKYVNYEVKIIAFNSIGEGPASTITSVYVGEAGRTIICRNYNKISIYFYPVLC